MLASHAPCFADPNVRIRTTMRSDRVSRNTGLPNAFSWRPLVFLDGSPTPKARRGRNPAVCPHLRRGFPLGAPEQLDENQTIGDAARERRNQNSL